MASRVILLLVLVAVTACQGPARTMETGGQMTFHILDVYPHDREAFTQGLLFYNGCLYESTGGYGSSELRHLEVRTGRLVKSRSLPKEYFGEGLARIDNTLVQLTWHEETAFVYDLDTFDLLGRYSYEGEGWGLCFDGRVFYRSDGSSRLFIHSPGTFEPTDTKSVLFDGNPVADLNELECAGNDLYANRYMTDEILRIDKHTGRVTGRLDARELLTPEERAALPPDAVLNGIAYDDRQNVFYLTGKRWPKLFKVRVHDRR
ncbi:MAG: glutaminyl-peptide cyclotransferase [Syntrophales bacterium]|nr:glutaminyl-peptide cyclotransferase [Syntrophales bacterium]MCK9528911.1 glutaminyl-peptide cyclotransferase [Syntrophales bacterium]MDX9922634.1 glutaminyl-peptide cyclotransferase [Syntrophales bacterium]